tara:strand:- start:3071 stop:3754 length:684 start_codon:yes stop_codon:yes gene_type:complete
MKSYDAVKKWKKFIIETKSKYGSPKEFTQGPFDRSRTKYDQEKEKGHKEFIREQLLEFLSIRMNPSVPEQSYYDNIMFALNEKITDEQLTDVIEDLKVLLYIYQNRQDLQYKPYTGSKLTFNDREIHYGASRKLSRLLDDLGVSDKTPRLDRLDEVFKFYVMPNNFDQIYGAEPVQKEPTEFEKFFGLFQPKKPSVNLPSNIDADKLASRNRDLRMRNYLKNLKRGS